MKSLEKIGTLLQLEKADSEETDDDNKPASGSSQKSRDPDSWGDVFQCDSPVTTDPDAHLYRKGQLPKK